MDRILVPPRGQKPGGVVRKEEKEEEEGLIRMAVCAARTRHRMNGIEFDESRDIDILTDIKFVVVTIGLPLRSE